MESYCKGISVTYYLLLAVTISRALQNHLQTENTLADFYINYQTTNSSIQCKNCIIPTLEFGMINFTTDNIIKIDLNNTQIIKIEKGTFKLYKNLKILILSHNKLRDIFSDIFTGLNNLKMLNLGYNDIISIKNAFSSVRNVEILNLEHNKLASLAVNEFSSLSFLTELNLSYNNLKLLNLIFDSLDNVKYISLHHNDIKFIDKNSFEEVRNVENLDLSFNKIIKIESKSFFNFQRLENLNLSFNKLRSLTSDQIKTSFKLNLVNASFNEIKIVDFSDLFTAVDIDYLDVSNNEICTFLTSLFSHFSNVNIQNNYLTCNKETEIKKIHFISDDKFIGSQRCIENNPSKESIETEFNNKCELIEENPDNSETIKTVLVVLISAPLVIILLYCGFVKKRTYCKTYNDDDYNNCQPPTTADVVLDIIDDVVQGIRSAGHGDNNNEDDDGGE